jgi:hypothetical protein
VRDLLDDFVAGNLEPSQVHSVEKHLRECAACGEEAEFVRALGAVVSECEKSGEGYHIGSQLLADLALNPQSVHPDQKKLALDHLSTCKQCSEELGILRGISSDIGITPSQAVEDRGLLPFVYRFKMLLVRPVAPAWVAVACVAALIAGLYLLMPGRFAGPETQVGTRRPSYFSFDDAGESWISAPETAVEEGESRADVGDVEVQDLPSVPPAFPVSQGREVVSSDDMGLVLDVEPAEIMLGGPGESFYCLLEKPGYFLGVSSIEVSLIHTTDLGSVYSSAWRRIRLAPTGPSFIIPFLEGTDREGDFILFIRGTPTDPSLGPKISAYHLSISFKK